MNGIILAPTMSFMEVTAIRSTISAPETVSGSTARFANRPSISNSPLICRQMSTSDCERWDQFVLQHPQGSPFHLIAWKKTIEQSFGYRPLYLIATQDDRIRGILPIFLVSNPIVGKVLLSSPFAVYGGILADCDDALRGLYQHVLGLGRDLQVDYIEFRNAYPEQCAGPSNVSRYVSFSNQLESTEAALMDALPKKSRNMVRKALKQPFEMRYDVRNTGVLDTIHSKNMRRLGTPSFPRRYFDSLLENFGPMADIREVWLDGKIMAASLNLYFRGDMHTYHAAADTRFNSLGPNTFMYFDHLRWAGQNGYKTFDFGRCKKGTNVLEFKKQWNTTMRELPYEIVLIKRRDLPNFSPANPRFVGIIKLWQKLPLPLARALSRFVFPLFP